MFIFYLQVLLRPTPTFFTATSPPFRPPFLHRRHSPACGTPRGAPRFPPSPLQSPPSTLVSPPATPLRRLHPTPTPTPISPFPSLSLSPPPFSSSTTPPPAHPSQPRPHKSS